MTANDDTTHFEPVSTQRLVLRAYRPDDLEATLAYYALPDVVRYTPFEPWTRAVAEEQMVKRLRRTGIDDAEGALGVVVERDGEVIGDVALWCSDDQRERAEIGWAFHPAVHGNGYATEAVRAVIDLAFGRYGLQRVVAHVDPRNAASARVCERVAMTKEGHLRRDSWCKGEWTDLLVYGLLAPEWTATSGG
jgi:RimJ/RimL family protein N-acetyltransferase